MFSIGQSMTKGLQLALAGAVLVGMSSAAQAATVAYWQFEGANFLADSSGNGATLTNNGSVTQVGAFENPFPGNQVNNNAASFSGSNYFTAADFAAGAEGAQISVEAIVRDTTTNPNVLTKVIAAHLSTGTNRSWYLGLIGGGTVENPTRSLRFFGENPTGGQFQWNLPTSSFTFLPNTDYYVGATLDLTEGGAGSVARPITFYIQDLTSNGLLQTFTINSGGGIAENTVLRDADGNFSIGATGTPSAQFTGLIDEVRISNVKLAANELLINTPVPEPATLGLLALGGLAAFGRRRGA